MGLTEIEFQLQAIHQKVDIVTHQAAQHYEKVEGAVDEFGKKAILTPVTALIFAVWSVVCVVIGGWVF